MATSFDMNQSDESLMARIQTGDHQAFAHLVQRHSQMFFGVAFRIVGHVQDAEDIVQDCFLKLWSAPQKWQSGRGAKFTTWFYRIVTNAALDKVRARRPSASSEILAFQADPSPAADERLNEDAMAAALEAAIEALPERQRLALTLCFYEGLSNREAADILEIKLKALESLLIRAKSGVRQILEQGGWLGEQASAGPRPAAEKEAERSRNAHAG